MSALTELFSILSKTLDDVVAKVDDDLPQADDINEAIKKVGGYAADAIRLPAALAKLEAEEASVKASIPVREKLVRQTRHAITMLEHKHEKLCKDIDRNRAALSLEKPAPVSMASEQAPVGLYLPASRQEIVDSLLVEILAAEDELAALRDKAKKAESSRKGAVTRVANLGKKIDAAKKAIADHDGRLEEVIRVLRKTISFLKNRQEKRDIKRKKREQAAFNARREETIAEIEAENAATDENLRKMAEAHGLPINGPDDLEAARQLFLN